jgi:hypothetical protein
MSSSNMCMLPTEMLPLTATHLNYTVSLQESLISVREIQTGLDIKTG